LWNLLLAGIATIMVAMTQCSVSVMQKDVMSNTPEFNENTCSRSGEAH
jgi:hypothetical protein